MPTQEIDLLTETNEAAKNKLATLLTALVGAKLKLYQSSFAPVQNSPLSAFAAAEADFAGYAAATLTWSAMGVQGDGTPSAVSSRAFFQATDAVTPNQIGGAWLELAGGEIWGYFPFNDPADLQTALSWVALTVTATEPGSSYAFVEL